MEIPMSANDQSNLLSEARNLKALMLIYMMNGFQMRGQIIDFDDSAILVESEGRQQLLFRHAVSTVTTSIEEPDLQKGSFRNNVW